MRNNRLGNGDHRILSQSVSLIDPAAQFGAHIGNSEIVLGIVVQVHRRAVRGRPLARLGQQLDPVPAGIDRVHQGLDLQRLRFPALPVHGAQRPVQILKAVRGPLLKPIGGHQQPVLCIDSEFHIRSTDG